MRGQLVSLGYLETGTLSVPPLLALPAGSYRLGLNSPVLSVYKVTLDTTDRLPCSRWA